mgnify:FL=1
MNSSSFKSVHDIAPVMESYGLRQRRGRETQWHAQNENIDDGFQESCHINDGSWRQNTYNLDEQNDSDEEEDDGDDDDDDDGHDADEENP